MISYKDVWHGPFRYDGSGYIWDKDNIMAFTFNVQIDPEFAENMVKLLNESGGNKLDDIKIKGCELIYKGKFIGDFRGWGHLTGTLKLTEDEALDVQSDFISDCVKKMKKDESN